MRLILLVVLVQFTVIYGDEEPKLPPILGMPDEHNHMVPSVGNDNKPLLGRPDGHEAWRKQPKVPLDTTDGHERKDETLLGRPDGHEEGHGPVIGKPDGHERVPLLGRPDGHEEGHGPVIGKPDGHERVPLLGRPDGHERNPLIGRPDGHEEHGKPTSDDDDEDESTDEDDESTDDDEDDFDMSIESDFFGGSDIGDSEGHRSDEPMIRCKRPICDKTCPNGFQTDANGCPVCSCLADPCDGVTCSKGELCIAHNCLSQYSCTKLSSECIHSSFACPIPMCANECPNGYKKNEYGCMTCDCASGPSALVECPEIDCINICSGGYKKDKNGCNTCTCVDKSEHPPCPMPMCMTDCPNGYANDENGCMTCDCASSPSALVECPQIDCISRCSSGYKKDKNGCNTCSCVDKSERPPCPMPMCMTDCPNGYANDENGCMTCNCKKEGKAVMGCPMVKCAVNCIVFKDDENGCRTCECDDENRLCGDKVCDDGQICKKDYAMSNSVCAPQPLCHARRAIPGHFEGRSKLHDGSDCDEDGTFKPLQCTKLMDECWCVDDTGHEISGTRTSVYIPEHKPHCEHNITVAVTIRMLMLVDDDRYHRDIDLQELRRSLPHHLSTWLLLDKAYISVIHADHKKNEGRAGAVLVEIMIRYSGTSDLPSAVAHMKHRMHKGRCYVPLGSTFLVPEPESVVTEHKFSLRPKAEPLVKTYDNGVYEEQGSTIISCISHHKLFVLLITCGVLLLLTIIVLTIIVVRRKRQMRNMNFARQRLESQLSTNSEKCLINSRDDNVVLMSTEPLREEKVPIA